MNDKPTPETPEFSPENPDPRRRSVLDRYINTPHPDQGQPFEPSALPPQQAGPNAEATSGTASEKTFACYTEHATTLNSVDIHLSDGSRIGCPYHLMRPVRWNTDQSRVTLVCDLHTLIIQGIRLEPIYKGLLQQSISVIQPKEDIRFVDPTQTTETLIESICLQDDRPGD